MGGDHLPKIHPVELVAGEDQHVLDARLLQVAEILPHGVGGALIPVGVGDGLLGGQDLDEAAGEAVEVVASADMAVETDGVELGEHVDAVQPAVDAVRQGNVDQAILRGDGHGRLGTELGQWIESGTPPAAENQSDYVSHELSAASTDSISLHLQMLL